MNAVLDKIEEPELLLKQAIREMEEMLISNEQQIKLLDLEQKKLSDKENELKQSLTELDKQLKLCFESDKDDLAHVLVKRKLETTQYFKSITGKLANAVENSNQLKVQLKEQHSQLNSMKQKADIFNRDTSVSDAPNWNDQAFSIQDEDIEVAFLHEKQKWSQS
jgi:phage shock protein A